MHFIIDFLSVKNYECLCRVICDIYRRSTSKDVFYMMLNINIFFKHLYYFILHDSTSLILILPIYFML